MRDQLFENTMPMSMKKTSFDLQVEVVWDKCIYSGTQLQYYIISCEVANCFSHWYTFKRIVH
jgi:hypothetical protein